MPRRRTINPVRPSAAIEETYRRRLDALLEEMHRSLVYWLTSHYRANEPEIAKLAADDSPAVNLRNAFRRLARRWTRRFDDLASDLAKYFATQTAQRSTAALASMLKRGGMSVKFRMSRPVNDAVQASIAENVGLIKSIAQQHLTAVEGHVMRSVQVGRDLGTLTEALHDQFGVTKRRAAFIAQSQNNKMTAVITRTRQIEAGIHECQWLHSGGGRVPRPSHVKAGRDKVRYDPRVGWFDPHEKKYIFPGELINCFPGSTLVGLEHGIKVLWRSFFHGPMVHIVVDSDLLLGTPNHPVLTARGWVPLYLLECGDEVVRVVEQKRRSVGDEVDERKTTFDDLFEAARVLFGNVGRDRAGFEFYGERPQSDVDEVSVDDILLLKRLFALPKNFRNLLLSGSYGMVRGTSCRSTYKIFDAFGSSCRDVLASLIECSTGCEDLVSCDSRSDLDVVVAQDSRHDLPRGPGLLRHGRRTHSVEVELDDPRFRRLLGGCLREQPFGPELLSKSAGLLGGSDLHVVGSEDAEHHHLRSSDLRGDGALAVPLGVERDDLILRDRAAPALRDAPGPELLAELVRIAADDGRRIFECGTGFYEFHSVIDTFVRDASCHVYTMQSDTGYYSVGNASFLAKNCRCVNRPVIPGFS